MAFTITIQIYIQNKQLGTKIIQYSRYFLSWIEMEDFFSNMSITKVLAILIGGLLFYSLFKENFMMTKKEREHLDKIGDKTNNKLKGKTVMAIFYLVLIVISLTIGLMFYKN